jgi:hypothetical protein
MKSKNGWMALLSVGAVVMMAAGCTATSDKDPGQKGGAATKSAAVTSFKAPVGAITDLTNVKCERNDNGVWNASAKLHNSSDQQRTYIVRFVAIKKSTSEVLGEKKLEVQLAEGASKDLTAETIYAGKQAKGVECAPVVTLK